VEWRSCQIEGWEVSEYGRVRKTKTKRLLKTSTNADGYVSYATHRAGCFIRLYAHQAVAFAWLGPCPAGLEVDHIDKVRSNNHYSNLRYITKRENLAQRRLRREQAA